MQKNLKTNMWEDLYKIWAEEWEKAFLCSSKTKKFYDGLKGWTVLKPKCECGAAKTSNPNLHATWCPCFEKDDFESDSERMKEDE